jgi:hypothetical protein
MSSVAHGARLPVIRHAPPGWRKALIAGVLGWFIAQFAVIAVMLVASPLGLLERPQGTGLSDWPYPDAGWSSVAANTVVWVWILALTALLIRGLLADRIGRPISAITIFCALAITGFAPFIPHGLLDLPWVAALVGTAALLRLEPYVQIHVWPKRATAKALAVGALFLAVPAMHGVLHPLWSDPSSIGPPVSRNLPTVPVENTGFVDVELESVALRSPVPIARLVDVRVDDHPPFNPNGPFASPGLPYTLEARDHAFLQLRLRHQSCGTGAVSAEAVVRYRLRGDLRTQALPVEITLRPCS